MKVSVVNTTENTPQKKRGILGIIKNDNHHGKDS